MKLLYTFKVLHSTHTLSLSLYHSISLGSTALRTTLHSIRLKRVINARKSISQSNTASSHLQSVWLHSYKWRASTIIKREQNKHTHWQTGRERNRHAHSNAHIHNSDIHRHTHTHRKKLILLIDSSPRMVFAFFYNLNKNDNFFDTTAWNSCEKCLKFL